MASWHSSRRRSRASRRRVCSADSASGCTNTRGCCDTEPTMLASSAFVSMRNRTARHVRAETGMRNLCLAGGVALNCRRRGRAPGRRPSLHVDRRAGRRGAAAAGGRRRPAGLRTLARGPLRRASSDACRLLCPPADGRRGASRTLRHAAAHVRGEDRLPGDGQHQLQRPGRADRPDARRRVALLHGDRHGCAGPRPVRPLEGTAAGGCAGRRGGAPRPVRNG